MSAIYFHSEHGDARIKGSERAYASLTSCDLALTVLRLIPRRFGDAPDAAVLATVRPPIEARWAVTSLSVDGERFEFVLPDGSAHRVSSSLLNTAIAVGSRPVQLLARLHGQCEIHAWVDGKDRAWLAGVIDEGRRSGVLRARSGWEEVAELLRSRDDGEVVTSFSGCDQFPSPHVIGWAPPAECREGREGDEDDEPVGADAFYGLDPSEQWRIGMEWLRAQRGARQITPENLSDPEFFGTGLNGFKLLEALSDEGHKRQQENLEAIRARGELPSIYDL